MFERRKFCLFMASALLALLLSSLSLHAPEVSVATSLHSDTVIVAGSSGPWAPVIQDLLQFGAGVSCEGLVVAALVSGGPQAASIALQDDLCTSTLGAGLDQAKALVECLKHYNISTCV